MAGATLSAWPSSSAASCSRSFLVAGVDMSLPPKARPAARPATSAADELPIPRVGCTALMHSKRSGGTSQPSARSARYVICGIILSSLQSSRSDPSPVIVIENLSARSTMMRFHTSSAKPKESKPGPRLAVVAGTLMTTRSTGLKNDSCTRWMREWMTLLTERDWTSCRDRPFVARGARSQAARSIVCMSMCGRKMSNHGAWAARRV